MALGGRHGGRCGTFLYVGTDRPQCFLLSALFKNLKTKNFFKCLIDFWLHWVSAAAHGLPLVVVCGLLITVASLVAEHGL